MSFKPENHNSVSPYLMVDGVEKTIQFLQETFEAEFISRFDGQDGFVDHAEVRIDDTVVMMADNRPGWDSGQAFVHVYVPDVDVVYAKALAAGAESIREPMQQGDPNRRAGVKGPGGTTWWIATQLN